MYIFFMFKNNISKAIDWNYIQINDSQYHSASKLTDICRIDKKIRRNTGALAWTSHKRTNLRPLFKRKKTFALLSTKKKTSTSIYVCIFLSWLFWLSPFSCNCQYPFRFIAFASATFLSAFIFGASPFSSELFYEYQTNEMKK